ncbi:hypothetical protein XM38_027620 [Halomicronema hongdechloris C2206]|uniref:TIR domain-containing protein n=1 Tax=Halomicronema hongdechloris C2206 TaxID=1641165 RepID=A0A1Z3HNC6_9CYAN|nr:hypothetical protein [Halomicronema hongdechloris]ASC71808.1 hypothetical protein XM38_027620 [Halomicronema hongdechloris C2206]
MQKITLFLASSSELKADREQFEIFIYRRCKAWFDRGIFLHLDIWEDFLDAMAPGGLQSEYNRAIRSCDLFVLLAYNKVGKYTAEEFRQAFGQFSATQKPFIFTYFKTPPTTTNREELQSLWAFEDTLKELQHYKTEYHTIEGLREHFGNQLEKLAANGFIHLSPTVDETAGSEARPGPTATVTGDGNKVYQDIQGSSINDSSKTYNIDKIDSARFE